MIQKFDGKIVDNAIENGVNYLWSLNKNARWSGLPTLAGESDIWVTGFIIAHISHLSDHRHNIKGAQKFLFDARQILGGWSYSAIVPPDADSSAWCLLALKSCPKMEGSVLDEAKAFLWSHYSGNGISTFTKTSSICEFIEATANISVSGWTSPHTDVSLAAVLADIDNENVPKILAWLLEQQAESCLLNSYWWRDPYYSTALWLRALSQQNLLIPDKSLNGIVSALIQRQLDDGGFALETATTKNSFNTALALESFCHLSQLGHQEERMKCGNALLQSRQENGSWVGNRNMRIPAPDVMNPEINASWDNPDGGGNSFIEDKDGLFATALSCYALDIWRRAEAEDDLLKNETADRNSKLDGN